ncbi:MAG: hypothetical protein ACR2P1_14405 [Pseudomonadales bacterium]
MNRLFDLEEEVVRVKNKSQKKHQASMQLAIDAVGYVTKTDKGGAYLHPITTNPAGNITAVKSIQIKETNRTRIPTGGQVSVDSGNTFTKSNVEYVYAQYNNKTGAVRKSSIVMLGSAAKAASVVISDVVVTDTGIQEKSGATPLYNIRLRDDEQGGIVTQFMKMGELKTVPLGAKVFVHPNVHSTDSDSIVWAMHVSGANSKVGAVNKGDVLIASEIDNDNNFPAPKRRFNDFFEKCWTTPALKALYRGFMRTQFNAENLDFLSAVAQIRNATQAQHVVDFFVKSSAKQSVNLGGSRRGDLINAITNPPPAGYPDWRVPFGFHEQHGTTFVEHINPPAAAPLHGARLALAAVSPCKEIYQELSKQEPKPELKNPKERKNCIAALIKDPGG